VKSRADLVLDSGADRVVKSSGDPLAHDRPIPESKPMDSDLNRTFGHTELGGEHGISANGRVASRGELEPLEMRSASRIGVFGGKQNQQPIGRGQCPIPCRD
jgi:hypothetical protein